MPNGLICMEKGSEPWVVTGDRVLCISDVHQDILWARKVLEHEVGQFDKVVWMGDILDSHRGTDEVVGARATGRFLKELLSDATDTHHVCLGNHDLPYAESWAYNHRYTHKHYLVNPCSGFSRSKAMEVNKALTWEDWQRGHLFYVVNGWLVSHAGVHPALWMPFQTVQVNLRRLWDLAAQATLHMGTSQLLACGTARGGGASVGGLTWLDWNLEFVDELPLPQLVGHTHGKLPRMIGRSCCIDGDQTTYAIISRDGAIQIKSLSWVRAKGQRGRGTGEWIANPAPQVVDMSVVPAMRNRPAQPDEAQALKAIVAFLT